MGNSGDLHVLPRKPVSMIHLRGVPCPSSSRPPALHFLLHCLPMEHSTAAPPLMKDIAADEDHSTSSADHLRGLLEAIDTEDLEGVLAALRSLSKEEVDGVGE